MSAVTSDWMYAQLCNEMDKAGITFADLGIDPKNEKYGSNGLLPGASHINYDAVIDNLQSALDRYNSNLKADTSDNDTSSDANDGNAGADDVPDAGDLEIVPAEIDVTNIPASSDASDESVHIFADYYGNSILYDEAKTQEALTAIDNYAQSFKALLILLEAMMLF